jgi:hypothetical protein
LGLKEMGRLQNFELSINLLAFKKNLIKGLALSVGLGFLNPMWSVIIVALLILMIVVNLNDKWREAMVSTAKIIGAVGGASTEGNFTTLVCKDSSNSNSKVGSAGREPPPSAITTQN